MTNIVPIRDWYRDVRDQIEDLSSAIADLPAADLAPGYQLPTLTVLDLRRVHRLVAEALQLLGGAVERDSEPYEKYCLELEARGIEL